MQTSWRCFALIVIEGAQTKEILCYRSSQDDIAPSLWRLPGGSKKARDVDFIQTLTTTVRSQTGIDIRRGSGIRRVHVSKQRMPTRKKWNGGRKHLQHERFYVVTITPDRFLDEFGSFRPSNDSECEFKSVQSILGSDFFFADHQNILRAHFNL